jgi:spermidine synthase
MAICLALFGITVGAVIVHVFKKSISKNYSEALYISSLLFSATVILNLACSSQLRAFNRPETLQMVPNYLNLVIIFVTISIPLICSGVGMSIIFERYAKQASRIYFVNLIGASLGCLLFIPLINFLEVVNSYFLLAFMGLVAAYLFNCDDRRPRGKLIILLSIIFALMAWINHKTEFLELHWVKGQPNNTYFYKKWNSFSYVRLHTDGMAVIPKGWSWAPKKINEIVNTQIKQIQLDIDGGAGTVMTDFEDRNTDKLGFLKYDVTSLPYHLVRNGDVLVIGVGAGRDILTGLVFDERSITGVEINDTILQIHRKMAAKFNGDLSRHPKVTFINNEARSYINASNKKFDIIQISLIDTFAATQAGAYALSENNLYTTQAIQTYWDHLTDRGMLSISYLTSPYMLRIVGAATKTLDKSGIKEPRNHFVVILSESYKYTMRVSNLLVKKTPFTDQELNAVQKYCDETGFHFLLSKNGSPSRSFLNMSDIKYLDSFARNFKLDISPTTDDKPFFFLVTRLDLMNSLKNFNLFDLDAGKILISLFILMLSLTVLFVFFPLLSVTRNQLSNIPVFTYILYFTSIGLAFMFVEMSQITRLSSFLGHPIYSLSLVLFSFLFGSGLGSYTLAKTDDQKSIMLYSALFILYCFISGAVTEPLLRHLSKNPIQIRMLITVIMLFPLAFFMGSFLPQGIRLLSRQNGPVALFWGLNGAASVLGSILAMIFQIQFGLSATFFIGAALYILAIGLLLSLNSKK